MALRILFFLSLAHVAICQDAPEPTPQACQDAVADMSKCSKDNSLGPDSSDDEGCAACGDQIGKMYAECEEYMKDVMELPKYPCFAAIPFVGFMLLLLE